jgi:hypothetical protein
MNFRITSMLAILVTLCLYGCSSNQINSSEAYEPTPSNEEPVGAVIHSTKISTTDKAMLCHSSLPNPKPNPNNQWSGYSWADKSLNCYIDDSVGKIFVNKANEYQAMGNQEGAKLLFNAAFFLLEKNIEKYEKHWTEKYGPETSDSNIFTLGRLEYLISLLIEHQHYQEAKHYTKKMIKGVEKLSEPSAEPIKKKYLPVAQQFQTTLQQH